LVIAMDDRENALPHSLREQPDEGFVRPGLYLPPDDECQPVPILGLIAFVIAISACAAVWTWGPSLIRVLYQHFNG
jgi:hypothetical protein